MKKLTIATLLIFTLLLGGCSDVLVDLDTPRSEELSAQYDFYGDSMNTIRVDMGVTPEQADEVFVVLVSCGLDGKINTIKEDGGGYTVRWGTSTLEVALNDGVVSEVSDGRNVLYPDFQQFNELLDRDVKTADAKNANGDVIGEWAYISILKSQLEAATPENFADFVEARVSGSGYNWFTVKCDDGTGIVFAGSAIEFADYGTIDDDGQITELLGTITRGTDGTYTFESVE